MLRHQTGSWLRGPNGEDHGRDPKGIVDLADGDGARLREDPGRGSG
jgi:hypothetical protein